MTRPGAVAVRHRSDAAPDLPGDAPVVVLANSLGATYEMWSPQVPELSARFRTIRYDARGHGGSPVPPGPYSIAELATDLVALLDELGVERAHLVGLSLGGMTAMHVAAHHPERVEQLVVLCTSARLGPASSWLDRASTVRTDGAGAVAAAVVGRWYTEAYRRSRPDVTAAAEAMVASTPAEGYAACCEAIASMDLTADLGRIGAPTLAIAGAADPATPPEHLERIARAIPGARLLVVDDAAHLANAEQPEQVTAAILHHLNGGR